MTSISFRAMGTSVEIMLHSNTGATKSPDTVLDAAKSLIMELEGLLSRFQPTSDVSKLNQSSGDWIPVHPSTIEVLALARMAYADTKGMFNPCLGVLLENLGYRESFEHMDRIQYREDLFSLDPWVAPMHCPFQINQEQCLVRLDSGYKLDLGGIAKGWIVNQASGVLREAKYSSFLCNAGGDMICSGMDQDHPWQIGIVHPDNPDRHVSLLDVSDLSIATSGTYKRHWMLNGESVHHIIDPYLGEPVKSDIASCTVVHENLVQAEILAKVALILGTGFAEKWLIRRNAQAWVLVTASGEVVTSWKS